MDRFFIYKEYGTKYDMMKKDSTGALISLPHWERNQAGLEALFAALQSADTAPDKTKRASTLNDLLVKVR